MSLEDNDRNELVKLKIEKAFRTFADIPVNAEAGQWNTVANRLYYAAYHIVSALLVNARQTVRTHDGIIQRFGYLYVKTKRVPLETGMLYSKLFDLRLKGDYDDKFDATKEMIEPRIKETRLLLDTIQQLIYEENSTLADRMKCSNHSDSPSSSTR